ncbi:serine/threonine protein kinase [Roseinatronobacter alkalisoli]|uniref:non-specific serine/threonine protein kinase n=1 Tax=Roseinatronobacter alkalisoli TaxID=3028235 RepID=A0ABT5TDH6_9RHOB|nr:serine/threonine protein kinase [Roseinatronobacter sp. HJB301]MDD7971943.1 protein kinase [Roseinatronobacter sp. HJB301]
MVSRPPSGDGSPDDVPARRHSGGAARRNPLEVPAGTLLIGTYEILEHINTGGMGEVYRGVNIHNDEVVAIKIVLPALAHDEKILSLFQKESTVLRRIAHDAIVRYEVFTRDPAIDRPCLIMEYAEGPSLGDRLELSPLPLRDVLVLLLRMTAGLEVAHRGGVVHRDLSPDNVILCGNDVARAKIIDFGIAKASTPGGRTLIGGQFAGKPGYVAPEQLGLYDGHVTGQADIYSLGLMAAAAALGYPIDMGDSPAAAVMARVKVPDLGGIDPELVPLLDWMLQPDPADRPASMSDINAWITGHFSDIIAIDTPLDGSFPPQTQPPRSPGPQPVPRTSPRLTSQRVVSQGQISPGQISQDQTSQGQPPPSARPAQPAAYQPTVLAERPPTPMPPVSAPPASTPPASVHPATPPEPEPVPESASVPPSPVPPASTPPASIPPASQPPASPFTSPATPQDDAMVSAHPAAPTSPPAPAPPVSVPPPAIAPSSVSPVSTPLASVPPASQPPASPFASPAAPPDDAMVPEQAGPSVSAPPRSAAGQATLPPTTPPLTVAQPASPFGPVTAPPVPASQPDPEPAGRVRLPVVAALVITGVILGGAGLWISGVFSPAPDPQVAAAPPVLSDPAPEVDPTPELEPTPEPEPVPEPTPVPEPEPEPEPELEPEPEPAPAPAQDPQTLQAWLDERIAQGPPDNCSWLPRGSDVNAPVGFAGAPGAFSSLQAAFTAEFDLPLTLTLHPLAAAQCHAVAQIAALEQARAPSGRLGVSLPATLSRAQTELEGHITGAAQGHLSVLMIDPAGQVQNITGLIEGGAFALSGLRITPPQDAVVQDAPFPPVFLVVVLDTAVPLATAGAIPSNAILPAGQAGEFWRFVQRDLNTLSTPPDIDIAVVAWID